MMMKMKTTITKKNLLSDEEFCARLVTRNGFVSAYWDVVKKKTAYGEKFTYKEVFTLLNNIREDKWGESLFPSYESFYMWLRRRN